MPLDNRMIWIDLETFGLDPKLDFVTEIGFKVTDLELNVIDDFQTCIWTTPEYDERLEKMKNNPADKYVFDMHTKSGLWDDAQKQGIEPWHAEDRILTFLDGHGIRDAKEPLCGSSVHFDRAMLEAQFPQVFDRFHYRIVDNSVLKTLCEAFAPEIHAKIPNKSRGIHRVLEDLDDTIEEFRFYRDNFIWDTREEMEQL